MKRALVITLLLFLTNVSAQNFKFGKVSKTELEEKQHPLDPDANAAVLFSSEKVYYDYKSGEGFEQVFEVHKRIKIYNKEGFDWANKSQRLFDKSNASKEEISGLSGYTFTLENGKVKKTKLKKESIFEEKNNKFWATKKFTMPNVKEGCVVEYKYSIRSPYIRIDEAKLQFTIPVNKLEYKARIPEYFIFKKFTNPRANFIPKISESQVNRNETTYSRERTSLGNHTAKSSTASTSNWSFKENKTIIEIENVPALKDEPLVRNLDNYAAKLIWEYSAYRGPDLVLKDYSISWDGVAKSIYQRDVFGSQIKKTNYFKEDIDPLINALSTPMEKAAAIYSFVKRRVRHNGYIGYYVDKGVKNAYKEKTGNLAEINLMLTAMLQYAGLNANPVVLSTRNNGVPLFPNTEGFNYVITAIENEDGSKILLDASNPNGTANILPEIAINWKGRIIRKSGSSDWINLMPNQVSQEIVLMNFKIDLDLTLKGNVQKRLSNYLALSYRDSFGNTSNEALIRELEGDKGDVKISNLEVKDKENLSKPVSYNYDFVLENEVENIGGEIYVSPLLFLATKENLFKQEKRIHPIDFIYPLSSKYYINIDIPEGYVVESMPENAKVQLNISDGEFSYFVKQSGNKLQFVIDSKLNKPYILPEEYEQFKTFFSVSFEKESEQIVLVKQ